MAKSSRNCDAVAETSKSLYYRSDYGCSPEFKTIDSGVFCALNMVLFCSSAFFFFTLTLNITAKMVS